MDEGLVLHQPFGMIVPHIDMIAEHIVMLDLQRGNAGRLDIALLQGGDQSAALVTKRPKLVERGIIAGPDKPAIARQKGHIISKRRRQLGCQRRRGHDRGIKAGKIGRLGGQLIRRSGAGCGPPDHVGRRAKRLCQGFQVTRTAMPHRQPGQRPIDVGQSFHRQAQFITQVGLPQIPGDQVKPPVDGVAVGKRRADPRCQQAPPGGADRHVDGSQQAAAGLAGQGAGDFQRPAGGLVDFHVACLGHRLDRAQPRHIAFLRQLDIAEKRAGGGQHGARELAISIKTGNPVIAAQRPLAGGGVKQGRCLLGQQGAEHP